MQGYIVDDTQRNNSNTRDGIPVNNNNGTQIPESRQSRNQTDNSICNQSPIVNRYDIYSSSSDNFI